MKSKLLLAVSGSAAIVASAWLPHVGTSVASSVSTPNGGRVAVVLKDGAANIAPQSIAKRDRFVRIATPALAKLLYQDFGLAVIWTYDPLTRKFVHPSRSSPDRAGALYVRLSTNAKLRAKRVRPVTAASSEVKPSIGEGAAVTKITSALSIPFASPATSPEPLGVAGNWTLSFDDEFSGTSLNTVIWTPFWFTNGGVSNGTVMNSSNVSVYGGYLHLALANSSGALVTTNPDDRVPGHTGYQFTYGYLETRVYVPATGNEIANWPAVWATGQVWPQQGELDVMEGLGGKACYHFHDSSGASGGCVKGDMTGWHTFGALWAPERVTYYYDGVEVGSISSGITSKPLHILLENSTSGAVVPSTMLVDYVRVWTAVS